MTIHSILESYLKSLLGTTIKVYGYKHPKIPRRYFFKEKPSEVFGQWEYMGEIDVIIDGYYLDFDHMRDSDGEFEVEAINASIIFIHEGVQRNIDIQYK